MVDVKLQPREFSKRRGGANTPQFGDVPSLRNLPGVRDVGTEAQAQALISMADDSKRLEQLSGEQFDVHMREVKTLQAIEAEKSLSHIMVATQAAVDDVRLNTADAEDIPQNTMNAYSNVRDSILNKETLSSYQRRMLDEKLIGVEQQVAQNSLRYQSELRKQEAEFAIDEIMQSRLLLASKNPALLENFKGEVSTMVEDYGLGLTALEKAKLKDDFKQQMTVAAVSGLIKIDPYSALNQIKSERFTRDIDFSTRYEIQEMAEAEIKSREVAFKSRQTAQKKAVNDEVLNRSLKTITGTAEEGEEISLTDVMTNDTVSPDTKKAILTIFTSEANKTGNPKLTNELMLEISKRKKIGEKLSNEVILKAVKPEDGQRPISISELNNLLGENEKTQSAVLDNFFGVVAERPEFKDSPIAPERIMQMRAEVNRIVQEREDQGKSVLPLFTPGTGEYIGDSLIESYKPTMRENVEAITGAMMPRGENPFENIIFINKNVTQEKILEAAEQYDGGVDEVLRQLRINGAIDYAE